jgi:hypothetical protein
VCHICDRNTAKIISKSALPLDPCGVMSLSPHKANRKTKIPLVRHGKELSLDLKLLKRRKTILETQCLVWGNRVIMIRITNNSIENKPNIASCRLAG